MAQSPYPETTAAAFLGLPDGMNGGMDPQLIKETAYFEGINLTVRNGLVATRPAFVTEQTLSTSLFQGAGRWSLNSGDYLAYVMAGNVYIYKISTDTEYNLGLLFDTTVSRCYFAQADRWLVVQDGTSRPAVFYEDADGVPQLYGRSPDEVSLSVGTIMHYAHGRIHYVPTKVPELLPDPESDVTAVPTESDEPGQMTFVSSDIRDSLDPQWVFRMSEHRIVNEGGAISLPGEFGFIGGMTSLRNADTGTGVGPLIIFGREGVSAFGVGAPRSEWKSIDLGQVLFYGSGTQSPFSVLQVNDDITFIDTQGQWRTLKYATTQLSGNQGALSNTPISYELGKFIDTNDISLSSMAMVDNRVFGTVSGSGSSYFKGLGVMDLARFYSLNKTSEMSYDGIYTGFKFQQIIQAKNASGDWTLYAFVQNDNGGTTLLSLGSETDVTEGSGSQRIEAQLLTRAYDMEAPLDVKMLQYAELRLAEIRTDVNIEILYRPVHSDVWSSMGSKTINVPDGSEPQYRRRIRFTLIPESTSCDPVTQEKLFMGHAFQFAIKWTGSCRIDLFRAIGKITGEIDPSCGEDNPNDVSVLPGTGETVDSFSYEVTL